MSQTLCTRTFVSGLDPDEIYREQLRPQAGMGLISWAVRYRVDRDAREVRTHIAGAFERRSVFAGGRGCTLLDPDLEAPAALEPLEREAPLSESADLDVVAPETPGLR